MAADGVLLIGFGGPTCREEVRPFLENVARGRRIPAERLEEVAHHYEEIGGCSPFNELTFRQAEALGRALVERGRPLPIQIGTRNWRPSLSEAVAKLRADGVKEAVGVVLSPHRTDASWERYHRDVEAAREEVGEGAPTVTYLTSWHADPGFLEAQAARVEEATGHVRGAWPAPVPLIFTAHSVPIEMAERSPYVSQLHDSAAGVAGLLGVERWRVVYQSRSGDPRQPWLEPDINAFIRQAGSNGVREMVLVPIGFLCDHVEVLYDLDIEARATAAESGILLHRAGTVTDHPSFIEMLAELVLEKA